VMISTRLVELVIDTVVCLTLAKWETVSGQFGGYLRRRGAGGRIRVGLSINLRHSYVTTSTQY